jgi:hypothetical protein
LNAIGLTCIKRLRKRDVIAIGVGNHHSFYFVTDCPFPHVDVQAFKMRYLLIYAAYHQREGAGTSTL